MNRTVMAWVVAAVLAIGGVVPFFTGAASMLYLSTPAQGPQPLVVIYLPFWSAALLVPSSLLVFVLVGRAVGFARFARPLLIMATGAWALDITGFLRVGPSGSLVLTQPAGAMFRQVVRSLRETWSVSGPQIGWIMLVGVFVVAVLVEMMLSRKKAQRVRGRPE
ncbi:MAG TPA: hypothetical protein VFD74_06800 [Thermoleophilia bacterium]|nr:hypothetical protein [Thermoleophilia bacterium]